MAGINSGAAVTKSRAVTYADNENFAVMYSPAFFVF